jgi:signal transduction histidine kinase
VNVRRLLFGLALAAAYVAAARFGLTLGAVSGFAAPVWPPTGLAFACLLLGGWSLWPGVLVAAASVNLWAGAPLPAALGIGCGNTLEAVLAVWALRRTGFDPRLERIRDVGLLSGAALISALLSAGIGVSSLRLAGVVSEVQTGAAFRTWWVGDVLGALVVAPLLLTAHRAGPRWSGARLDRIALAGFTALSTWFVFSGAPALPPPFRQPFLVFPALVWTALRVGQGGAVTATAVVSAAAIAATVIGRGPFAGRTLHEGLLALQVFMGVVSVGVLLLGAASAERRRVQEELKAAVAIRDEFLTIAGHELRTPLAALTLDLGSLQRRLQAASERAVASGPDVINRRAVRILKHAERLNQLVDRLLDASRLQQGRLRLEVQPLDLRAAVEEVIERFAEQAEQAGCPIALEASGAHTGCWDPMGVEQVVSNLIANAIKYGRGKPIEVSLEGRDDAVVLTVRDQGLGVPADQVARIFDRFARAASSRHFGGLGLGLYITRQIVEAHGGSITVASEHGAGASFIVQLPRTLTPAAAPEMPA